MKRFLSVLLLMMMIAGAAFATEDQQQSSWEDMISEEEVIAIARAEVAKGFEIEASVLDDYGCSITLKPNQDHPYWEVCFEEPDGIAQSDRIFNYSMDRITTFETYLYPNGKIILPVREAMAAWMGLASSSYNPLDEEMTAFAQKATGGFVNWPLEVRAEYSETIRPKVRAILESGDLTDLMAAGHPNVQWLAQSTFIYGVPDEKSISQEEALALAKAAITKSYGVSPDFVEQYESIHVYYDITDASVPLWKFLFNCMSLPPDVPEDDQLYYKVELNAYDGSITFMNAFPFMFNGLNHDLEYHVSHY